MTTTASSIAIDPEAAEALRQAAAAHTVPSERAADPDAYLWVSWKPRNRKDKKAFALATSNYDGTGQLRSLNGAAIPESAVMADTETPRDAFCLGIIAGLGSKTTPSPGLPSPPTKNEADDEGPTIDLRISGSDCSLYVDEHLLSKLPLDIVQSYGDALNPTVRFTRTKWALHCGPEGEQEKVASGRLPTELVNRYA